MPHKVTKKCQWLLADPCVYCYGPAETIDHIVPRSQGGKDYQENLAPACRECNVRKGSKRLLIFLVEQHDRAERSRWLATQSRRTRLTASLSERLSESMWHTMKATRLRLQLQEDIGGVTDSTVIEMR